MPGSCEAILGRLDAPNRGVNELRLSTDAVFMTSGTRHVTRADALWPRLETSDAGRTSTNKEIRVTELPKDIPPALAPAAAPAPAPAAPQAADTRLSIDEFMKIDLGAEQRTIVAGIAEAYEADALVGKTVAIVANLKPAKLMGVESNGMILAASPDGGKPMLVAFDNPPPPGTRIR
jgi:methionyl-tRNA synthetase